MEDRRGVTPGLKHKARDATSAITDRLKSLFTSTWEAIVQDESLRGKPPHVSLRFSARLDSSVCARIEWDESIRIVISQKFILTFHEELQSVAPTLARLAFASRAAQKKHITAVVGAVEEMALSFILLHEIFHLMGGHMGWMSKRKNAASFDERLLGLAFAQQSSKNKARPTQVALSEAYLLESEADCTALQWLIQFDALPSLCRLLRTRIAAMMDFPSKRRPTAFRLALTAIWLVIRKMESSRAEWMQAGSETHPLPITRLFAAFGTFVQEYSVISDLRFDDRGGGHHKLSRSDVTSMQEFLREVLGPVLKADWNPHTETLPARSLEVQMTIYFPDFANHLLNRKVSTVVGREILQMERARFGMDRKMKPFRFFPVVEVRGLSNV